MFKVRKRKPAPWNKFKTVQNLVDFCEAHHLPMDTPIYMVGKKGKVPVEGIYFHEISGLTLLDRDDSLV